MAKGSFFQDAVREIGRCIYTGAMTHRKRADGQFAVSEAALQTVFRRKGLTKEEYDAAIEAGGGYLPGEVEKLEEAAQVAAAAAARAKTAAGTGE